MNIMTKRGNLDNVVTYEHICDSVDDLQNIELQYITLGSVAIVLIGESGGLEVYMANSRKEWIPLFMNYSGDNDDENNSTLKPLVPPVEPVGEQIEIP